MQRSFKCCRNKEFLNFCCVSCSNVFHPSCLDRVSDAVKLGGYKIYCSRRCQATENEAAEKEKDLINHIQELENELKEKDRYIERLKRNSAAFDDAVYEAENKLVTKLDESNKRIQSLEEEIKSLRKSESELKCKLRTCSEMEEQLQNNIRDLTDMNRSMVVTIDTLEKDNYQHMRELETLRQKTSKVVCRPSTGTPNRCESDNNILKKRKRILIIGNDVRGYLSLFKRLTHREYDINCQGTDSSFLEDSLNMCIRYSRRFTKDDYVFLFISDKDSSGGNRIDQQKVTELLQALSNTNTVLIGPSLSLDRPVLNKMIASQNRIIDACARTSESVMFIPMVMPSAEQKGHIARYLVVCCIFCGVLSLSSQRNHGTQDFTQVVNPLNVK